MKVLHIVPGTRDISNGMVVVAKLLANAQGDATLVDLKTITWGQIDEVEEVWIHGMWLPKEWRVCLWTRIAGKRLIRMPHGSLSPIYVQKQSKWEKRFVSPIERYCFRRCAKIVATCDAEKKWIDAYLGSKCSLIEVADVKRFFDLSPKELEETGNRNYCLKDGERLHLLYLGRRHPLKGLMYLEEALRQLLAKDIHLDFRVVRNAFGEEKEKAWEWCDVLVLPTLSENFGLVIAEALERGKSVITTDGAPAWSDGNDYGGRLIYLKGYRDGTPEERVRLLKTAIEGVCK